MCLFFTDPHIGVNRLSHTTSASRARLKTRVYETALGIVKDLRSSEEEDVYCLGDLFDSESNDEATILQGAEIASRTRYTLAGNHDLSNRKDKLSSLQLLALWHPNHIWHSADNRNICTSIPGGKMCAVPHVLTQELFDKQLRKAVEFGRAHRNLQDHLPLLLLLHCNYGQSHPNSDTSLMLSRSAAAELLLTFDFILIGHEHDHKEEFNGRLRLLGCTHPTSFADCGTSKYAWRFDGRSQFIPLETWNSGLAVELPWDEFLNCAEDLGKTEFLTISGTAPPETMPKIAAALTSAWKHSESLLMARNLVTTNLSAATAEIPQGHLLDLPNRISEALKGSDVESLWQHYLKEETHA